MKDLSITTLVCLVFVCALVYSGDATKIFDVSWRVVFRTIGFKTVGKSGKASIQIIGRSPNETKYYDLAVGQGVTSHSIGTSYIGEPTHVKVRFLDQNNSWNLQQVEISRTDNVYNKYIFQCWCWVTYNETKTLPVSRPMWILTIFTGNKKYLYTDKVWVKIFGTHNVSRKIDIYSKHFRIGTSVTRVLYTEVIGIPKRIQVGHTTTMGHANNNYHFDKIELTRGEILSSTKYVFNCDCVIHERRRKTVYISNPRWRVSVGTGRYGTDDSIYIKLVGTAGESSFIKLDNSNLDDFKKSSWDHFKISTPVIGEVKGVVLGKWGSNVWSLYRMQIELMGSFDEIVSIGFRGGIKGPYWKYSPKED